jgi:acetoacetate decarboxylase
MIYLLVFLVILNLFVTTYNLYLYLGKPKVIQQVVKRVGDTYHICEFCKKNLPDVTLSADQHWACSKCRKIVLAQ